MIRPDDRPLCAWLLKLCCEPNTDAELRLDMLLESIAAADPQPDMVCLQQITPEAYARLVAFAINHQMMISTVPDVPVVVVTMWRPFIGAAVAQTPVADETPKLQLTPHSKAGHYWQGGEAYSCVCVIHGVTVCNAKLPANSGQQGQALKLVLQQLTNVRGPVLLLLSCNFDIDREDQLVVQLDGEGLTDAWRICRPQDPGYTADSFHNPLYRKLNSDGKFRQLRADAIFARDCSVIDAQLIFCQTSFQHQIPFSDRFGVSCHFAIPHDDCTHSAPVVHRPDPLAHAARQLICAMGEDPMRQGILKTPSRSAKAWLAFTEGYRQDLPTIVNEALFDEGKSGEVVLVRDITFYSMCEHHMVPFYGRCHVAYVCSGKVIGISKIVRIVEMFAKRLQVQERLTRQIAAAVDDTLEPLGVAVMMSGVHMCMCSRGVRNSSASTVTSCMHGVYKTDPHLRNEFFGLSMGPKL